MVEKNLFVDEIAELTNYDDDEHKDLPKLLADGQIVNIKSKLVQFLSLN